MLNWLLHTFSPAQLPADFSPYTESEVAAARPRRYDDVVPVRHGLARELAALGAELPLKEFGQGFRDMAPAVDTLERLVAEGRLRHGGNPILTMCAANAVIERDAAGNRKLAKHKSTGRIDGLVALAMALAACGRQEPEALPACLAELLE